MQERARHLLQDVGEVLGPHPGVLPLRHGILPEQAPQAPRGEGGLGGVADGGRVQLGEVHRDRAAVGRGDALRQLLHHAPEPLRARPIHGAHGPADEGLIPDHVLRGTARAQLRDGRDHRLRSREGLLDLRRQGGGDLDGGRHGVARVVRLRAVPAGPVHGDAQDVGRGHVGARPVLEGAPLTGVHVEAVGGDDARARGVEHPLLDHRQRAARVLLARLEHEHDVAGQRVPVGAEDPCGPDQPGGVQVVPAGVHGAGGGGELLPGFLEDRQPVHVPARQDGGAVRGRGGCRRGSTLPAQHRGDGGEGPARGDLQGQTFQLLQHPRLRPRQVRSQLRIAVQLPAEGPQLGADGFGGGQEGGGGAGGDGGVCGVCGGGGVRHGGDGSGLVFRGWGRGSVPGRRSRHVKEVCRSAERVKNLENFLHVVVTGSATVAVWRPGKTDPGGHWAHPWPDPDPFGGGIPACAGSTPARAPWPLSAGGSSPYARGTPVRPAGAGFGSGLIPVCAGSTSGRPTPSATTTAHPRMRGEHAVSSRSLARSPGSSPHARGARQGAGRG